MGMRDGGGENHVSVSVVLMLEIKDHARVLRVWGGALSKRRARIG